MPEAIPPDDPVLLQLGSALREASTTAHLWHAEEQRLIGAARDQFLTAHIKILQSESRGEAGGGAAIALNLLLLATMCLAPQFSVAVAGAGKGMLQDLRQWFSARLTQLLAMRQLVVDEGAGTLKIALDVFKPDTFQALEALEKFEDAQKRVADASAYLLPIASGQFSRVADAAMKRTIDTLQRQTRTVDGEAGKNTVTTKLGTYPSVRLVDHLLRESNWERQATLYTLDRCAHEVLAAAYAGSITKVDLHRIEKSIRQYGIGLPSISPEAEAEIVRFIELAMWAVSYPFGVETKRAPIAVDRTYDLPVTAAVEAVSDETWRYLFDRFVDPDTSERFSADYPRLVVDSPKVRFSRLAGNLAEVLLNSTRSFYAKFKQATWGDLTAIRQPAASTSR